MIPKNVLKYLDKNKNFNELSKDIFNNAVSVLEWAEGLDENKNDKVEEFNQ